MNRQLVMAEVKGVVKNPARLGLLTAVVVRDGWHLLTEQRDLYSYATTNRKTADSLHLVMRWLRCAQRSDGGIAAYYSLLAGYAPSYAETTGYLVPTFYDYASMTESEEFRQSARRMTEYLLPLQLSCGAFPAGVGETMPVPSVFNSGQILMGLVRAYRETGEQRIRDAAIATGDWLLQVQHPDGRWEGPTYQGRTHTYYTMVAWALAVLGSTLQDERYLKVAQRNVELVLRYERSQGWFDGINLSGHPNYLHFIAYLIQGLLETALLVGDDAAVQAASRGAWRLLRCFEICKQLPGAFGPNWRPTRRFACLTGNAQLSCVWLRLYQMTDDLRYLNAALKVNESLKGRLINQAPRGVAGGVAGSYPIWTRYHPLHYINWGAKFMADALMGEVQLMQKEFAA